MVHLKRSVLEVKAKKNCLVHALVIAKAKVDGDPNYNSYSRGYKTSPIVDRLLETAGIDFQPVGEYPS